MIRIITTKGYDYYEAMKYVESRGQECLDSLSTETIRNIQSQVLVHQELSEGRITWNVTLILTVTLEP